MKVIEKNTHQITLPPINKCNLLASFERQHFIPGQFSQSDCTELDYELNLIGLYWNACNYI